MDDPRLANYPFVPGVPALTIVGGEGSHLLTADGRRILDGGGGAVVANIGHGRPEPAAAAARSLTEVGYVLPLWATEGRLELVERLRTGWLPQGIDRCLLVSGGSEAVDSALRVARGYHLAKGRPRRWKMLGRSISYHGATLATLSLGNHDRRRRGFEPLLSDTPKLDPLDLDRAAAQIEAEDPETVAAVVVEPVSGSSGGALVPPPGYLAGLRRLCTEHDILLVADEVMTGFGRTGSRFAVEHDDVTPDILVSGKGLGGGYVPIGGVFAGDAVIGPIAEAGQDVMYFTFSGSDVACRVASEVLRILEEEELVARAALAGDRLAALLRDALGDHPQVSDVRGRGLLQGIELVADRADGSTFDGNLTPLVVAEALRRDCWIYPAGSGAVTDALLFAPPFVVTDAELEHLVAVAATSIDAAVTALRRRA